MSDTQWGDLPETLLEVESISKDFQEFVGSLFENAQKEVEKADYHVEKGVNLKEILSRLSTSIPRMSGKFVSPDTYNHISIVSQSIQGYLKVIEKGALESVSQKVHSDANTWISNLFGIDSNMHSYYHERDYDGLLKVCKLALHARYTKYATDGFTALYTRPPVIYLSVSAPPEFGKRLRSELGLPQSSMCSVPCNTMFGSPFTMDVAAFERLLTDDVSCGKTPLILIAYAGTPISGHTDNLSRLREICTQSGVWFHVEGDTLANLTMPQVQPSIQAATMADSLTLNFSKWYAIPNLPYCTFFQSNNIGMAYSSGLITDAEGLLKSLPIWLIIQFMGTHVLKAITEHASGLSQQMSNRLDMVNSVKRIEQPTGLSPVVIFKYTANVPLPVNKGKDDILKPSLLQQGLKMDVSPNLCDKYNSHLASHLKNESIKVIIDQITIPHEGVCLRFNPLQTSRTSETTKDDINNFIEILQNKVNLMDYTQSNRIPFKNLFTDITDVVLIDVAEEPVLGAFQCIPTYWKTKSMANLSDSKKEEANELNLRLYNELYISYSCLQKRILSNGQLCIVVGMIDENVNLKLFVTKIANLAIDLQDNSKFVDSVKDSVEENIREAQAKLDLEREEKLYQEGLMRNVPIVSSLFNWLSPPPVDHGIIGHSFDLTSGKLDKTENVYKLKMQVYDDNSDAHSHISRRSILSNVAKSLELDDAEDDESVSGDSVQTLSDVESVVGDISPDIPVNKLSESRDAENIVPV